MNTFSTLRRGSGRSILAQLLCALPPMIACGSLQAGFTPMFLHDHDATSMIADGLNNYGELVGRVWGSGFVYRPVVDNQGQTVWYIDANKDGKNDLFRFYTDPDLLSVGTPNDLLHAPCTTTVGGCLWDADKLAVIGDISTTPYFVTHDARLSNSDALPGGRVYRDPDTGQITREEAAMWQGAWVDLGLMKSCDYGSSALAVNDQGWVAGTAGCPVYPDPNSATAYIESVGFLYHDGTFTDIGNLGGVDSNGLTQTHVYDINAYGEIVGWSYADDGDPATPDPPMVFIWLPKRNHGLQAGMHELSAEFKFITSFPGKDTLSINDKGQIAGVMAGEEVFNSNGNSAGFLPTGFFWLPESDYGYAAGVYDTYFEGGSIGENFFKIFDINNQGVMIGKTWDGSTYDVGFLVPDGYMPPAQEPKPGTGVIIGTVTSNDPIETVDNVKVHTAHVILYDQNGVVLRSQGNKESNDAYMAYIRDQSNDYAAFKQVASEDIQAVDAGNYQFKAIPTDSEELTATGSTAPVPKDYLVLVTSAETREIDVNNCDTIVTPVEDCPTIDTAFLDFALPNQRPDTSSPYSQHDIYLVKIDGTGAKLHVIDALTNLGPHHYGQIEDEARIWVNGTQFSYEYQIDALKRARFAELAVRHGAIQSRAITNIMLGGISRIMVDLFDKFFDGTRQDLANREREAAEYAAKGGDVNPALVPHGIPYPEYMKRMNMDRIISRGKIAASINFAISQALDRYKSYLELNNKDTSTVDNLKWALDTVTDNVQKKTLRGGLKASLKQVIDAVITASAPILFDGTSTKLASECADITYTGLTCSDLLYSVNRMQSWSEDDFNQHDYQTDRRKAVTITGNLDDEGSGIIASMAYLVATTEALGQAQAINEKWGTINKIAEVAAKIEEVGKYLGNAATVAVPAYFIYANAPRYVKNGVYQAYGETPPQ